MFCGYILFPLFLILAMWKAGILEYNFTGLLNEPAYSAWMKAASLIMLVWCLRTLWILSRKNLNHAREKIIWMIFFGVSTLGAVFTPYIAGTFFADLHLFFSYTALICFNVVFYFISLDQMVWRNLYLGMIFFCALLCIASGEISGPAELVFGCSVSILLTQISK